MRTLLIAAIVAGSLCWVSQGTSAQCPSGVCVQVPGVYVQAAPPMIYQPRVTYSYQPYQYQGTTIQPRTYATPIRNRWFGRYRIQHQYVPVQPQNGSGK